MKFVLKFLEKVQCTIKYLQKKKNIIVKQKNSLLHSEYKMHTLIIIIIKSAKFINKNIIQHFINIKILYVIPMLSQIAKPNN